MIAALTRRPALCLALAMVLSALAPRVAEAQRTPLSEAETVVRALYEEHAARYAAGAAPVLNDAAAARRYFADNLMRDGLQGALRFDPLYNAQAVDVTDLSIALDGETPALRGTAFVNATFRNFGAAQRLVFYLRVLPGTDGFQIINIRSEPPGGGPGWLFTDLLADLGGGTGGHGEERITLSAVPARAGAADRPGQVAAEPAGEAPALQGGSGGGRLIVLDASASMWGPSGGRPKIEAARSLVGDLLDAASARMPVGLLAYGHRTKGDCGDVETLVAPGAGTAGRIRTAVDGLTPRGTTTLAAALDAAAATAQTVVLLSDGNEACAADPCGAARAIEDAMPGFTAHAVDLGGGAGARTLRCIAEATGGRYLAAADALADASPLLAAATGSGTQPAPEPTPADEPDTGPLFEDTFDGDRLAARWDVRDPITELYAVDGGEVWFAGLDGNFGPRNENAPNRLVLDAPLPEGDFDVAVDFSLLWQSSRESVSVSLFEDARNQVLAWFWSDSGGCGVQPGITILSRTAVGEDDVEETRFRVRLFDGPLVGRICSKAGRAHADAVMRSITENGATLRLSRRGRKVFASLEVLVPPHPEEDGAAQVRTVETERLTLLRPSGRIALLAGNRGNPHGRESIVRIDRVAIEAAQ